MTQDALSIPIVIFGKGLLAINICDFLTSRGYKILVIPVSPEPNWGSSLSGHCKRMSYPTSNFNDFNNSSQRFNLGFSIYYNKIFKQSHIEKFDLLLNIHNSILPKYRGVNPVNWALKKNEQEHGVTLHRIDAGVDTGPIYGCRKFPINPALMEVEDLYNLCLEEAFILFCELFPSLHLIQPLNQCDSEATYFSANNRFELGERFHIRRNMLPK